MRETLRDNGPIPIEALTEDLNAFLSEAPWVVLPEKRFFEYRVRSEPLDGGRRIRGLQLRWAGDDKVADCTVAVFADTGDSPTGFRASWDPNVPRQPLPGDDPIYKALKEALGNDDTDVLPATADV